ncbi:MAG: LicD family protein [Bacteroidales bacterium]|nr:LicD family protein [Bacteroidales bacterium]
MIPESTLQLQQILKQTLRFTLDFLDRHNINYILCGGTLLGAVRHQGFIPWDDDVDIYLYREDYRRLMGMKDEIKAEGYRLLTLDDDGYYLPFAKLINPGTTIWEKKRFEFLLGAFVDIFPLDRFCQSDAEIRSIQRKGRRLFRRYQTCIRKNSFAAVFKYLYSFRFITFFIALQSLADKNAQRRYLQRYLQYEAKHSSYQGEKCTVIAMSKNQVYRCAWFKTFLQGRFEDINVKIPSGYDAYLKEMYGDYMPLPPEEKRLPTHNDVYINLKQALTMQEVKNELKKA